MSVATPSVELPERGSAVQHTLALTVRSLKGRMRQPAVLAPAFIFPLFFAALGSSSFSKVAEQPGFPADSFLDYAVAGAILQGVLFGATSATADLATDIEQGFFERLLASPVRRVAILLGRLASGVVVAMIQVVLFLAIFVAFGARVHSGIIGVFALIISGGLLSLAVSALMSGFAIRTGSPEAVQGAFPLVFILLFLSSAFFPRQYMTGWYRTVADWNPISHIVEGMQSFMFESLQADAFVRAWGIPIVIAVVSLTLAIRALNARLAAQ
jgi:ABC-2 type transport system permease protein